MGLKRILFGFNLLLFSSISWAQDSIPEVIYESHTEYKELFPNRITARLFYVNTSNSLTVNGRNSEEVYNLTPNKQNRIGASVSFRAITISYSFAPDFMSENKDNDDSKLFTLGFRTYFGKHWMQNLELFNEKGFYLKDVNNNIEVYLPETKSFKLGGATSYIFNENFSFRAIVSQDEKQLKSAGSFIPQLIYYYSQINLKTDDEFINSVLYSYDIALAPSYYYNFVPAKNLLISAGFSAGIGLNYSKNKDKNHLEEDESLTSLVTELNFSGSITYDISNFYLGAHYNLLILNHNTDRSSYVNDEIPFFQVFAGYRFRAPKKLVKTADELNQKVDSKLIKKAKS